MPNELYMFRLIYKFFLRWMLVASVFVSVGVQANESLLSKWDVCPRAILSPFFHSLLTETSAGYVLLSDKPVFLEGVFSERMFFPGTSEHRKSVIFGEAIECLVLAEKKDSSSHCLTLWSNSYRHKDFVKRVMITNKTALSKVIEENLSLFQSRLGWRASLKTFLDQILDPKEEIGQLYSGHPALLGICLGYGTQNSLLYERTARLTQLVTLPSIIAPFRILSTPTTEQELIQQLENLNEPPSLSYSSLRAELADITLSIKPPTANLDGKGTKIPFSYWGSSVESKNLLCNYREAQKKVQQWLNSPDYLDQLLLKLGIDPKLLDNSVSSFSRIGEKCGLAWIIKSIACSIWEQYDYMFFEDNNLELKGMFLSAVEKGLTEGLGDDFLRDSILQSLAVYRKQRLEDPKCRERNIFAEQYLSDKKKHNKLSCIHPKRLYYTTKQKGAGAVLDASSKEIEAHFLVQDSDGTVINGSDCLISVPSFNISDLAVGVVHGMQGMLEGEKREIYIHPDYMYGLSSSVGSGKPLIVTVQLVRIKSRDMQNILPVLLPVDLPRLVRERLSSPEQLNHNYNELIKFFGYSVGAHYRLGFDWISSQQLLSALRSTIKGKWTLNPEQYAVVRRIHWVLYTRE